MRTGRLDRRPKIFSIGNRYDGLQVAAKEDILWPCHAFNISIPLPRERALNVFEETILKLTEFENGDTNKISAITCLNSELVSFVQNRLNHLSLIDDRYELTQEGMDLLTEWHENPDLKVEYAVATVFVDLLSGKLLPYITAKSLRSKKIERLYSVENSEKKGEYENFVRFLMSPTREKSKKSARQIRPSKDSYWNSTPDSNGIIRSLREFRNRYKRYALLNPGSELFPYDIPSNEAISVNPIPELVYLHCVALIQVGNPEILVTDGCGYGFSESFANYLSSQEWQWLIDFKSKGLIDTLSPDESRVGDDADSFSLHTFSKYKQIERPLRSAHRHLEEVKKLDIQSSSGEEEYIRLISLCVVDLYEAIEWTLRHVVSENPAVQWEQLFAAQSFRENDDILRAFAAKIGFDIPDSLNSLLQVVPGKIKALNRGESEMQPLLAVSIAGAVSDHNHPLHHLAVQDAGCLKFIRNLKELRDPTSHGSSQDVDITLEVLENYRDRAVKLVKTLVPDLTIYSDKDSKHQKKNVDQERLKARIELESSIGFGFVQTISPSLREELIKLNILTGSSKLRTDQHQRCINIMSSVMQIVLFEFGTERRINVDHKKDFKQEALEKIVRAGFYRTLEEIPKLIRTVNRKRVRLAVLGKSTTLGAQLLEAFLVGTESELINLQQSDPTFVSFVAKLLRLRGHGNKLQINLSSDQIITMKNELLKKIKIIRGAY